MTRSTFEKIPCCPREEHQALQKLGREAFQAATDYVGTTEGYDDAGNLRVELELRNCRRCSSTLGYPVPGMEHLYSEVES